MKDSKIEWTDHTFNPWWGCMKVSPGCHHCYAETFAKRVGWTDIWGNAAWNRRRPMSDAYWRQPLKWDQDAIDAETSPRVFCASMADVFEDRRDLDTWREKLWALIEMTPNLHWLLLTKRPENIERLLTPRWSVPVDGGSFVPDNVWMLTTTENQEQFNKRVPHLIETGSQIHGISVEPMLSPISLYFNQGDIDWVICGGESGPGAREMNVEWARDLRDQCRRYKIPFFMKQMGTLYMRSQGKTGKGDRLEDLPEDLRIREYPEPR